MFKNYLKIAIRNLLKHKVYSLINVLGLAIGMACCILILLYVRDELSYDRFHEKADRIYRITTTAVQADKPSMGFALSPPALIDNLLADFPEVEEATGIVPYFEAALPGKVAISYRENLFNERFFWAKADTFKVFSFPLTAGNPDTALVEPLSVVLTESAARRYFGDEDPLGKVLMIDSGYSDEGYKVTGIMGDVPKNSHFHFDLIGSYTTLNHITDERVDLTAWWTYEDYSYIVLADGASAADLEAKFPAFIDKHVPYHGDGTSSQFMEFHLQPLVDIHLHSLLLNEAEVNSDISYIYILSVAAFLTLIIACVNFMNLSTARSASRAKEIGMRKVVGAYRSQVIGQFLGESVLLALLALVVAVLFVQVSLPFYNGFTGKEMGLDNSLFTWGSLLGIVLVVGVLAGIYPALFLSAFKPIKVLRGSLSVGAGSTVLRKALVIIQFVISVFLMIGTAGIFDQLNFMRSYDTGIDKEHIVVVPIRDVGLRDKYRLVKDKIERDSNVLGTSLTSLILGRELPQVGIELEGKTVSDIIGTFVVDYDFVDVFDVEVISGRNFSRDIPGDVTGSFMMNESALKVYGLGSPEEVIGQRLYWANKKLGAVIGVIKDFHTQPLRFPAKPMLLHMRPIAYHYMMIKIAPGDPAESLRTLEAVWRKTYPDRAFDYSFLDQEFDQLYHEDEQLGKVFGFFAGVAIFVACLGLLGLAAFTVEQRTKEIGIRKAMGATVADIVVLMSKDLTKLVIIAVIFAWPISYLFMKDWLQGFAYRVELNPWNFIAGGLIALLITWLTVGFQAVKAALANPADALRFE